MGMYRIIIANNKSKKNLHNKTYEYKVHNMSTGIIVKIFPGIVNTYVGILRK